MQGENDHENISSKDPHLSWEPFLSRTAFYSWIHLRLCDNKDTVYQTKIAVSAKT